MADDVVAGMNGLADIVVSTEETSSPLVNRIVLLRYSILLCMKGRNIVSLCRMTKELIAQLGVGHQKFQTTSLVRVLAAFDIRAS